MSMGLNCRRMGTHGYGVLMTSYKLCIVMFILLQFIVTKCKIIDQSKCTAETMDQSKYTVETMDQSKCTDETQSCKHDTKVKETENDKLLYNKADNGHKQQGWFSFLYSSIANELSDITNSLSPQYSEPDTPETEYSTNVLSEDISTEELLKTASAMLNQYFDVDLSKEKIMDGVLKEAFHKDEEITKEDVEDLYEYPPVFRRNPGNVGDVQYIEMVEGVKTKLITRAVRPPLFEIPEFMSAEDCDYIIEKSREKGLNKSRVFQTKGNVATGKNINAHRESFSSSLKINDVDEDFLSRIHDKVSVLIGMPKRVVHWSEHLAIGMYKPGGHYHAHLDSTDTEASRGYPCCFQTKCQGSKGDNRDFSDCCRLCRYVTILYYLNDVEEGGETAFPLADLSLQEMIEKGETEPWKNLTSNCNRASVVIKPEKGKAIMWYNHFVDAKGYMSTVDRRSYHGGCEVTKGTKWIATNWISTPIYPDRYKPSKYRDIV